MLENKERAPDEVPEAVVARIGRAAERIDIPCAGGAVAWRRWGEGPPLVLLHGGHGSWTHWLRNIPELARRYALLVPDMPGYGDSDALPEPHSPARAAEMLAAGIDKLLPRTDFFLAGFSFGGIVGGTLARLLPARVRRLVLVGAGGLRLPSQPVETLRSWRRLSDPDARAAAHRANLAILMIRDPARIDALAVHLQSENTRRARLQSRQFARAGLLRDVLPELRVPLAGIWGEHDATARGHLAERAALLREFDPAAEFTIIPGAGHWVQYEAPTAFDAALAEILDTPRAR